MPAFQDSAWTSYIPISAVPTDFTLVLGYSARVLEIDIVNPTAGPISFDSLDGNGQVFIPTRTIQGNDMLTYRSKIGRAIDAGLQWRASSVGLLGYIAYKIKDT